MSNYYAVERSPDYLEHYGILGMKWGIRRYQNPDGSLTEEGRKRYGNILTKDQMNNMIRSYNIRTGENKKINRKTVFKTTEGLYDYKGRKLDDTTEVKDDKKDTKKPSRSSSGEKDIREKKLSELSDQELNAINNRMQQEINYLQRYAQLHPENKTAIKQMSENLKNDLMKDLPAAVSEGIKQYIITSIKNAANPQQDKKPQSTPKPQPTPQPKPQYDSRNSNAMNYFGTRFSDIPQSTTTDVTNWQETLPTTVTDTSMQTLEQSRHYSDFWSRYKK